MNKIIIIFFLFSIFACTKRDREIITQTEPYIEKQVLVGRPLKVNIGQIKSFGIAGHYIVIVSPVSNPRLRILDLDNKYVVKDVRLDSTKYLKNPFYYNSYWIDRKGNVEFEIVDFALNQFVTFSMSELVDKDTVIPKAVTDIPFRLIKKYSQIFTVDSTTLLATSTSSDLAEGKIFIYKNHQLKWLPFTPSSLKSDGGNQLRYLYYSFISNSRKHSKFASALKYFPIVEFYKSNGEHVKDVQLSATPDKFEVGFLERADAKQYYNSSFAGDKFFYALCVNSAQVDYVNNTGNMKLHVFDWSGNLIRIYELDRMFLGNFIVDEKNQNLIVQSFIKADGKNPLIQYSLAIPTKH